MTYLILQLDSIWCTTGAGFPMMTLVNHTVQGGSSDLDGTARGTVL
jgi:hypothetical protein